MPDNYPSTFKAFTLNDKSFIMRMPTLMLQHKLETNEANAWDMLEVCTNMPKEFIHIIPETELNAICEDIVEFSKDKVAVKGENKKAIEIIAWLMNRGHLGATDYRIDFVRIIIEEMVKR